MGPCRCLSSDLRSFGAPIYDIIRLLPGLQWLRQPTPLLPEHVGVTRWSEECMPRLSPQGDRGLCGITATGFFCSMVCVAFLCGREGGVDQHLPTAQYRTQGN